VSRDPGLPDIARFASPIYNQGACGSCTAFGTLGAVELEIRKMHNTPDEKLELSRRDLFSCSGGTCNRGNYVDVTVIAAEKGVALNDDCPYDAMDHSCGQGRTADWWKRGKKTTKTISFKTHDDMRAALSDGYALVGSMAVYTSFFNYRKGVYQHLPGERLEGYHCISMHEYDVSDESVLIQNSWGDWGCPNPRRTDQPYGYCWIKITELDPESFRVVVNDDPIPEPGPDPSIWEKIWNWIIILLRRIFGGK